MPSDPAGEPRRAVVLAAPPGGSTSSEFGPTSRLLSSPLSVPWLAGGRKSVEIARTGDFSAVDSVTPSTAGTVAGSSYSRVQAVFRSAAMASHGSVVMRAPDSRTATVSVAPRGSAPVLSKLIQRSTTMIEPGSVRREPGAFADRPLVMSGRDAGELASSIIIRNSPRVPTRSASTAESVSLHRSIERTHWGGPVAPPVSGTVARVLAASDLPLVRPWGTSPRSAVQDAASGFAAESGVYVYRKHSPGLSVPAQAIAAAADHSTGVDAVQPLMLSAAPLPSGEGRPAPASAADAATQSSSQPASAPDIEDLVERVTRRLTRQLAIDHERRGAPTWR
jgi:hypothetical protein